MNSFRGRCILMRVLREWGGTYRRIKHFIPSAAQKWIYSLIINRGNSNYSRATDWCCYITAQTNWRGHRNIQRQRRPTWSKHWNTPWYKAAVIIWFFAVISVVILQDINLTDKYLFVCSGQKWLREEVNWVDVHLQYRSESDILYQFPGKTWCFQLLITQYISWK